MTVRRFPDVGALLMEGYLAMRRTIGEETMIHGVGELVAEKHALLERDQ